MARRLGARDLCRTRGTHHPSARRWPCHCERRAVAGPVLPDRATRGLPRPPVPMPALPAQTIAMIGDRLIRVTTALGVATVATVAAVISYRHAYELVSTHGETGLTARLVPFTVD